MSERIADLHRRIYYLEQQVCELQRHLDEKDHIIQAQVIMMAKLKEEAKKNG